MKKISDIRANVSILLLVTRPLLASVSFALFAVLLLAPSAVAKSSYPGAAVIGDGPVPIQKKASSITPDLGKVKTDKGGVYSEGCLDEGEPNLIVCNYGDGSKDVVVFGDSHAMHYTPAIVPLADERDWTLHVVVRGSCSWAIVDQAGLCNPWKEMGIRYIEQTKPDLVLLGTSVQVYYSNPNMDYMVGGAKNTLRRLKATGAKLLVMRDGSVAMRYQNKQTEETVSGCIRKNRQRLDRCSWQPGRRNGHSFDWEAAKEMGVPAIDAENYICRPDVCPLVIGNIIVNRDSGHYSATFMKTLKKWMRGKISSLTGL